MSSHCDGHAACGFGSGNDAYYYCVRLRCHHGDHSNDLVVGCPHCDSARGCACDRHCDGVPGSDCPRCDTESDCVSGCEAVIAPDADAGSGHACGDAEETRLRRLSGWGCALTSAHDETRGCDACLDDWTVGDGDSPRVCEPSLAASSPPWNETAGLACEQLCPPAVRRQPAPPRTHPEIPAEYDPPLGRQQALN